MCFYSLFSLTHIILWAQGVPQPCREFSDDSQKNMRKLWTSTLPVKAKSYCWPQAILTTASGPCLCLPGAKCASRGLEIQLSDKYFLTSPQLTLQQTPLNHRVNQSVEQLLWCVWYSDCQCWNRRLLHSLERLGAGLIRVWMGLRAWLKLFNFLSLDSSTQCHKCQIC